METNVCATRAFGINQSGFLNSLPVFGNRPPSRLPCTIPEGAAGRSAPAKEALVWNAFPGRR
jgi:hypothetical protein